MRKIALVCALVFMFALSIPSYAMMQRSPSADAKLTFSGGMANCWAQITSSEDEKLELTMKLYENGILVETWRDSGYAYLCLDESVPANSGDVYKMTVQVKIDGVSKPMITFNRECP